MTSSMTPPFLLQEQDLIMTSYQWQFRLTSNRTPALNTKPAGYNCVVTAKSLFLVQKKHVLRTLLMAHQTLQSSQTQVNNITTITYSKKRKHSLRYLFQVTMEHRLPVINRDSGEVVAILTAVLLGILTIHRHQLLLSQARASNGIFSDNPDYDIVLGGFFIQNTGFNYCEPQVAIWDQDTGTYG